MLKMSNKIHKFYFKKRDNLLKILNNSKNKNKKKVLINLFVCIKFI